MLEQIDLSFSTDFTSASGRTYRFSLRQYQQAPSPPLRVIEEEDGCLHVFYRNGLLRQLNSLHELMVEHSCLIEDFRSIEPAGD